MIFLCIFSAKPTTAAIGKSQCDFVEHYEKRGDKIVFIKHGAGRKTVPIEVSGIDAAAFKELLPPPILTATKPTYCNRVYATDGKNVFYRGDKLDRVAPKDFKVLAGGYAKTSTDLYWADIPISGVYLDNLKVLGWGRAQDGKHTYIEHIAQ